MTFHLDSLAVMSPTLELLPREVLRDISEILDIIHPPSLLAFARANKGFYFVASTVLFRTVKITMADEIQRRHFQDVQDLEKKLLRDDAFVHVRRLILYVHPYMDGIYPYMDLDEYDKRHEDDTGLWSCWENCRLDEWSSSEASIAEDEWEPVIRLVGLLTGLVDLFWACPEQFSPRLLQVLTSHRERRLHKLRHPPVRVLEMLGGVGEHAPAPKHPPGDQHGARLDWQTRPSPCTRSCRRAEPRSWSASRWMGRMGSCSWGPSSRNSLTWCPGFTARWR